MKLTAFTLAAAIACSPCVEWTRLAGKVKAINLRDSTVTIQDHDGDLMTVPIDYQVVIMRNKNELMKNARYLALDDKIILIRTPQEKPADDTNGMAQPESGQHGQ